MTAGPRTASLGGGERAGVAGTGALGSSQGEFPAPLPSLPLLPALSAGACVTDSWRAPWAAEELRGGASMYNDFNRVLRDLHFERQGRRAASLALGHDDNSVSPSRGPSVGPLN